MDKIFDNSRFLVYIIVFTTFISSIILYVLSINMLGYLLWGFLSDLPASIQSGKYLAVILLKVLDIGLIALVFQITSIALYQFFICQKENSESRFLKVLHIHDFHDLKSMLMQVATLILVVMFLEQAVEHGASLQTLYFAVAVSLVLMAVVFVIKSLKS